MPNQSTHGKSQFTPPCILECVGAISTTWTYPLNRYNASRVCIKHLKRTFITSSDTNHHSNLVNYGGSQWKSIAWGEDAASGGYDGAGTNGGTNVFVLTNSCGIRYAYWPQYTSYFYAGMHMLFMTMPVGAYKLPGETSPRFTDVNQWAARGSTLASNILANDNAPAASAWINATILSSSFIGYLGNNPNGGTQKFGANVVLAADTSGSMLNWRFLTEGWTGARMDSNDPKGNSTLGIYYICNYDCSTYGIE
jgi:hypothetical protein